MKLDKIEIKNFKGLRDVTFEPAKFNCLIGENNAGKSSVLQAIVFLLNRPASLPLNLFCDLSQPVTIRGYFSGISAAHLQRLNEEHRQKIASIVEDEKFVLLVKYSVEGKIEVKVAIRSPIEPRYRSDAIDDVLKGLRGNSLRAGVAEHYPEFLVDMAAQVNMSEAKAHIRSKIKELPHDQFEDEDVPLQTGISSSITALLPEPIYIVAVKNLNDDLKTTQSTSFGRLLGLLLDDLTPDLARITTALEDLNKLMNRCVVDGEVQDARHTKVRNIEGLIEGFLSESFPKVKVELELPPPDLKAILNTAQIYVNDGSRDLIDQKGDGIKRCLTFALLRTYVKKLREQHAGNNQEGAAAERPLIFLFEEPELYLHPRSQRILFGVLSAISMSYQVAVTTHSPIFFEPGATAVFTRVSKREAAPKPVGVLNTVNFDLDIEKAEVFRLAKFEHAEAGFFNSRVVLFEGESDDAFFSKVASVLNADWSFNGRNIGLVRVGGKGNFSRFRRFFEAFGIEVKVVADLDAIIEGFEHLGVSPECTEIRRAALMTVDNRINELAIRAEPTSKRVKKKVTQESWRARYDDAKAALLRVPEGNVMSAEDRQAINGLFLWEADEARLIAMQNDDVSGDAIWPLLNAMRLEGVCVLSKGAIEEYYPAEVEAFGAKPQRALKAANAINTREQALLLSQSSVVDGPTELEMIFEALFI